MFSQRRRSQETKKQQPEKEDWVSQKPREECFQKDRVQLYQLVLRVK